LEKDLAKERYDPGLAAKIGQCGLLAADRLSQEPLMNRQAFTSIGAAALAMAGLLWCLKAGTIMVTGYQPPLTLELGQLLFPVGIIGIYMTLDRPNRIAKSGLVLAILGLVGSLLGLLYPLLPGARISTGEDFVMPYSLFVLVGSVGGFAALLLIGITILRSRNDWNRWRTVPVIVAAVPLPLIATGLIHIEVPIFLIGTTWLWLAYALWRVSQSSTFVGRRVEGRLQ
jgi:hypothetical protein